MSSTSDCNSTSDVSLSAVKVGECRTPKHQGNLTGLSRKVKDCCADLHNQVVKWEKLMVDGSDKISVISSIKISCQIDTEMPDNLQLPCEQLDNIITSMEKIISKMKRIQSSLKGIAELDVHQQNSVDATPLFNTWPLYKFAEATEQIVRVYLKEYEVKKKVKENVAHTCDKDLHVTYRATWLHEVFVNDNIRFLLESMLLDTGLK